MLALLASNAGELFSREQITDHVWPDVVTTDDSLVQCIADIRRILGRDAIETVPKKGYLLRRSDIRNEPFEPVPAVAVEPEHTRRIRWDWMVSVGVAAVVASVFALLLVVQADAPPSPEPVDTLTFPKIRHDKSLAVLPFFNLGEDSSIAYFSSGLGEDLVTDLSKVPGLTVVAYASSTRYPDAESGFRNIAGELGVRFLLRGTVRRDSQRIRINVSLIDPYNGANLWSERYDRTLRDPFDVQENVARNVVEALALQLNFETLRRPRVEPGAYHMLLRGLVPLRDLTNDGNLEARSYFEKAAELDPEYARAHASIAMTYARAPMVGLPGKQSKQAVKAGLRAAVRAIQLEPGLPHAYYSLGLLNLSIGEYDHALAATRHALRLDPNYSDGYALLAQIAVLSGSLEEAERAISRAEILNPRHPSSFHWTRGQVLFHQQKYQEAKLAFELGVAATPGYYSGLVLAAANAARLGELDAGGTLIRQARTINPAHTTEYAVSVIPYRKTDRKNEISDGLALLANKVGN